MIISHKHKFIFIHIPKTGGTSVQEALKPFLADSDIYINDPRHVKNFHKHSTAAEVRKEVGEEVWNSYFKFAFVRNPWDAVVSLYHWWLREDNMVKYASVRFDRIRGYPNFIDFVNSEKDFIPLDKQKKWVTDKNGEMIVDFIGSYENLQNDLNFIFNKLGFSNLNLKRLNKSSHLHYSEYYDLSAKKRIEKFFEEDIKLFGYTFLDRKKEFELKSKFDDLKLKLDSLRARIRQKGNNPPLVSIITSIYKGDKYISEFLKDITSQTIFNKSELILINANSPGDEERVIREYMNKFSNIIYKKLDSDPGLYECWNMAIKMARGKFITTANLDDRRARDHIEKHLHELENNLYLDLVCAPVLVTRKSNETWQQNTSNEVWFGDKRGYFNLTDMFQEQYVNGVKTGEVIPYNVPHCMPVWKKVLHERNGFFDEKNYGPMADWEFWMRCLKRGALFKILDGPLGLYLLDDNSHNRKFGSKSKIFEILKKKYFFDLSGSSGNINFYKNKIDLSKALGRFYGFHRSGWNYALSNLSCLHNDSGILLDGFIEKKFVWGKDFGDARNFLKPHEQSWIGFVHNPPNIPKWFKNEQSLQSIFQKEEWKKSMKHCKGLFCLSEYLKEWLVKRVNVPVEVLIHPTETPEIKFDINKFLLNKDKKIIQIGFWLRKLNSIFLLKTGKYRKIMLKARKEDFILETLHKEREGLDLKVDEESVSIIDPVSDEEYDNLLSENIAFIELYDSSANNVIIECIVRNTPLLVNPLPAVVEYLGEDYPFYFSNLDEAARKAENLDLIKKTHEYLKNMDKLKFTGEYFLKSFAESEIYKNL